MFLSLPYESVTALAARGVVSGKNVTFRMLISVDELNLEEAVKRFRGSKTVSALVYTGELGFLANADISGVLVMVRRQFDVIDASVDHLMQQVPPTVRVVIDLPKSYADMSSVYNYSVHYKNLFFNGGNFVHLPGVHLGVLTADDIGKKVPESRVPIVTQGDASVFDIISVEDADSVEFYTPNAAQRAGTSTGERKQATSKPSPKKAISSLVQLGSVGKFDSF